MGTEFIVRGLVWCLIFVVSIDAFLLGQMGPQRQVNRQRFLAEKEGEWCGYDTTKELDAAAGEQDPQYVAIVDSREGKVTAVRVRRSTEDTSIFDEYTIGSGLTVERLRRTLDAIPEHTTRIEIWNLKSGSPIKISESWMEFRSHKPLQPDNRLDDYIEHAIIMRFSDFPFAPLVARPQSGRRGQPALRGPRTDWRLL